MSAARFVVGMVVSPRPWPNRLHAYFADHVVDIEMIAVRDQRAAVESEAAVLVVDEFTPWLTATFVEQAAANGMTVVGVVDRAAGERTRHHFAQLGVGYVFDAASPPDQVAYLLESLRPIGTVEQRGDTPVASRGPLERGDDGRLVVVGGPSGSGAREVAIAAAARWGSAGFSTVLVDVNETTPGVARRLGSALYPHVGVAVTRLRADDGDATGVAERVPGLAFDVIAGLPTTRDWEQVSPADASRLSVACRDGWERVVATSSPLLEDLRRRGDRFAVSRRMIELADVVVGCCEPTPRGVLRYLDWLIDVSVLGDASVVTVLNQVPRSVRVVSQVRAHLLDVAGERIGSVVEVPFDRRVRRAEWDGALVTRGRYVRAVARLVDGVEGVLRDRRSAVAVDGDRR